MTGYPTPDDLGAAPIWENYVVAQAAQAALGIIPRRALAVGVHVNRDHVELVFQVSELSVSDRDDMTEIVGELEALLGGGVTVTYTEQVRPARSLSERNGVRWFFAAHD